MKSFYVTTTEAQIKNVISEILRVDDGAILSQRRDNRTLIHVQSERFWGWSLESIPGVAHAIYMPIVDERRVT